MRGLLRAGWRLDHSQNASCFTTRMAGCPPAANSHSPPCVNATRTESCPGNSGMLRLAASRLPPGSGAGAARPAVSSPGCTDGAAAGCDSAVGSTARAHSSTAAATAAWRAMRVELPPPARVVGVPSGQRQLRRRAVPSGGGSSAPKHCEDLLGRPTASPAQLPCLAVSSSALGAAAATRWAATPAPRCTFWSCTPSSRLRAGRPLLGKELWGLAEASAVGRSGGEGVVQRSAACPAAVQPRHAGHALAACRPLRPCSPLCCRGSPWPPTTASNMGAELALLELGQAWANAAANAGRSRRRQRVCAPWAAPPAARRACPLAT